MYRFIFGKHFDENDAQDLVHVVSDLDILYNESLNNIQELYNEHKLIAENIHNEAPEVSWSKLSSYLQQPFGIKFYEKVIFELPNLKIRLQENPPLKRWDLEVKRLTIKTQYTQGEIPLGEAFLKLILIYQDIIPLEIEREKRVISGLNELNKKYQHMRIGLFMGSDHSQSLQHIGHTKEVIFEVVELAHHNYYTQGIGNIKKHYLENGVIHDKMLKDFIKQYLQED